MRSDIRRGDIHWVEWSPGRGSEQTGRRPALVVQTDRANSHPDYPNTVVVALSTRGRNVPFQVPVTPSVSNGLSSPSYVKCEQLYTLDKERLERRIGRLNDSEMQRVDAALRRVLDL